MLGLLTVDHDVPFHDSAKVRFPEPLLKLPTAVQSDDVRHDTEFSSLAALPGLGLLPADQADPSQVAIND